MATADTFGLVGQIIDSQLQIEEAIGEGGFSLVYKAVHLGLGEPVAVKCLKLPRGVDPKLVPSFTQRFREESRLCYRLSQGNLDIVRSMTSGTTTAPLTGEYVPYMALEWLDGVSVVTDLIERRQSGLRGRPLEEVVQMFQPAAAAIAYAHSQGVIHRDIKPGNLFLANVPGQGDRQRMKVLDFGLAKILDDEAIGMTSNVKTMAPFFFCSPSYGAPEQFDPSLGELGPWTDVYGFAMVLIEALTDQKARPATNVAEALAAAMDPRNKPTPRALGLDLGQEMEGIFIRGLAMSPKARWQNAQEFWDEFKNAAVNVPPMTQRLRSPDLVANMAIPGPARVPSFGPSGPGGSTGGISAEVSETDKPAFTPAPPPSVPNAAVYRYPAVEPFASVHEIHVDAEAIQKASVPPPFDPSVISGVLKPRRASFATMAIGVTIACLLVGAVVGLGVHLATEPAEPKDDNATTTNATANGTSGESTYDRKDKRTKDVKPANSASGASSGSSASGASGASSASGASPPTSATVVEVQTLDKPPH